MMRLIPCRVNIATSVSIGFFSLSSSSCQSRGVGEKGQYYPQERTCRRLPFLSNMSAATLTGVLAFGILSDDEPIEVASLAIGKGGRHSAENPGWPDVGVLLQSLTDGQAQTPELITSSIKSELITIPRFQYRRCSADRDMVGHVGCSHSAKEDGVETP
jgi:hypothetical protein